MFQGCFRASLFYGRYFLLLFLNINTYALHYYAETKDNNCRFKGLKRRQFLQQSSALLGSLCATRVFSAVKVKPLQIGIFPRRNIKSTYRLFNPMARYLSEQLGRPVELRTTKNFADFWQAVKLQQYDLVHFNQYHYVLAQKLYGYDVILKNEELGRSMISGSLIVRKDSGISTVQDLKNKTILFGGGRRAMQSYISPTWLLRRAGLEAGDYREKFAVNPVNTIISVFFRRANAAAAGDIVMHLDNVKTRIDTRQLKYLATTEPAAQLPWAVHHRISENDQQLIQNSLLNLHKSEAGLAILKQASLTNLLVAKDADYMPHRKIIMDVYGDDYGVSIL